ncbi:ABC transporter permease [Candidatus Soleaferrea massiliensis]|uniref:ABC transporter permease n=1 Tax=Candidatus Soleaferrea massiliensis TaxID=1470354 RepID=UPI00058B419C|nr:ABC transporter permease [Candidatus Soleaferrea massiliensis]
MNKLTFFELHKIWRRRSFLLAVAAMLAVNIFILWYSGLSDGTTPQPGSYKALGSELERMSESEKQRCVEQLYQDIQGVRLVRDVLNARAASDDAGKAAAQQMMAEQPGVFERYYDSYMDGSYLKYTGTLEQEAALITEVYEEAQRVFSYDAYLKDIQTRKETMLGISIFSSGETDAFSERNIEREAADYAGLGGVHTSFYPSKGVVSATQSAATDLLLLLSVFLFASSLIFEEKEKKLFYITRASLRGRTGSILAKLSALAVHCFAAAVLFYGANLLFFAGTAGIGDLFRSIQSVSPLIESNLPITVLSYLLLTVATKAAALFAFGAFLMLAAILAKHSFAPYLAGLLLLGLCLALYLFVPSYSSANWLKFLNFFGLMKTENLYGSYLNFNFFGYPVSRLLMSWIALGGYLLAGCLLSVFSFLKCRNLGLSALRLPFSIRFKEHGSLYRHEGYKILIMNRALIILLLFSVLLGYQHLSKTYVLTPAETYYQDVMLQLEGKLTPKKEERIAAENHKYEEAFSQIDRIDALVASGEIDEQTGESMKAPYYSETAFYPSFQRVLRQYEYVKGSDGTFIYDTGYLLLFGMTDNGSLMDFVLLTACVILAFSAVFSMEYQKKSWNLLASTAQGKRRIVRCKIVISLAAAFAVSLVLWICRVAQILRCCPMNQFTASTRSLPGYQEMGLNLPIVLWVVLMFAMQLLTIAVITLIVLFLSDRLKNHLQALFSSMLVLLVPVVLYSMGLDFAWWCSLLPVFNMASGIITAHGVPVVLGYSAAGVLLLAGVLAAFMRMTGHSAVPRQKHRAAG